ncbi:MAG: SemiSWEET transporter [Gammaproteobacteria bacterium]
MEIVNLIGSLAGMLTTVAFVPQVVRTWKTGSAQDISLLTYLFFTCGVLLWLVYGIMMHALPVIAANGVTLALSTSILGLKIRDMLARQRRLRAADQRTL